MCAEVRDKGYFEKGAMGMDHTGSQMEFVLGKAAMIPCGTWLGSEMKKQISPGFNMQFINPPVLAKGKGKRGKAAAAKTSTPAETPVKQDKAGGAAKTKTKPKVEKASAAGAK